MSQRPSSFRPDRAAVATYFLVLVGIGLVAFRDHGVPWDERRQQTIGEVSTRYVLERFAPHSPALSVLPERSLAGFDDRDYGVVFETPAVALQLLLGLVDTRDIYLLRHLLTYLVFVAGVFAVHRMAERRFRDWRLGLLAATLLVLSPRFFAEAFYNSKDVVFMAVFAIATNTMWTFVTAPRFRSALAHGLATAAAVDLRIVAIGLVPLTIGLLATRVFARAVPAKRALALTTTLLLTAAVFTVLLFPWLWEDPVGRFLDVLRNMANFQRFSDRVRYMGGSIMPDDLPWHYLPVWIAISTPIVHLVLFAIGVGATLRGVATRHIRIWRHDDELHDLVCLVLLCAPIAAIVSMNSIVYDGWRHVYFVYPSLLLLAVRGWQMLWTFSASRQPVRWALAGLLGVSLTMTAAWMVRVHPMQNVYFNAFAGSEWRRRFELDYWGLGIRGALEHILANDGAAQIVIKEEGLTGLEHTVLVLRPSERRRIRQVERDAPARYILTNYRGLDVTAVDAEPGRDLFYQLRIDNEIVLSVFRTREP